MIQSNRQFGTTLLAIAALMSCLATARATVYSFDSKPFEGSNAPTTPGRQIVGGEPSISFNPATDVFSFNPSVFAVTSLGFVNAVVGNIPATGGNVVVLRTFDNDNNSATPFGAGNAADLIANQITQPGPGFFVYFNSALDLARLVYSADLNANTADLKILARLTNLSGQAGRDAFPSFTADNFVLSTQSASVPDNAGVVTLVVAVTALAAARNLFQRCPTRHGLTA